jgi:hypothetical protein
VLTQVATPLTRASSLTTTHRQGRLQVVVQGHRIIGRGWRDFRRPDVLCVPEVGRSVPAVRGYG